jgi:DNA-binding NarL/FixJ family response regulator
MTVLALSSPGKGNAVAMALRIMIVDDQRMFIEGMRGLINDSTDMIVAAEATDGREALDLMDHIEPSVILMDIRMPRVDGIDATSEMFNRGYRGKVVILSAHGSPGYLASALNAGVSGYLVKDQSPVEVLCALRAVAAGASAMAPSVLRTFRSSFELRKELAEEAVRRASDLSQRELEVLECISRGLSNAEIASELGLRLATVKSHTNRILRKLCVRDRLQAALMARSFGL